MYKVFIDNKSVIFNATNDEELRQQFAGHKFVEAAGGIVQHGDAYLFIRRNGVWDIPKGKLDKGESPEEGAVREIEEECGLTKPVIQKHLVSTWHTYEHKGKHVLKKTYWYWLLSTEKNLKLVPQLEEGITEVQFFRKEDFKKLKSETYLSICEVIEAFEKII
jgi:8-oxo-dGTP pyrophosphatase MutT (NUDIX family)